MEYDVRFKPRAVKELERLASQDRSRILQGIEQMRDGLKGDVKHLTDFTPEYRLRIGRYRVLFEVEGATVIVYRILPRREAYRRRR